MTSMLLLDTDLADLFQIQNRVLLDRVVRAIALDTGEGEYIAGGALDRLHAGVDSTYGFAEPPTLRNALSRAGVDVDFVESLLKLLDQCARAKQGTFDRVAGPKLLDVQVNTHGLVLLDQGQGDGRREPQTDVGAALADPVEFERRLARMRAADASGQYALDQGRELFRRDDRAHLEVGVDIVASAERTRQLAAATAAAERVGRELDEALRVGGSKRARLKALEAELGRLDAPPGVTFDTARDELRSQAIVAGTEPALKLLDQLTALDEAVKKLDGPTADSIEQARLLGAELERRRQTEDAGQFLRTLSAAMAGEPLPERPPAPEEPEIPPDVHPGSHQLHERVLARMRELDAPESDYPRILDQVMREGA